MKQAIPKKLLIHSATLHTAGAQGLWTDAANTSLAVLSRVRVEPYNRTVKSADNTDVQLAALMFVDVRNSEIVPSTAAFAVGQIVTWNSLKYLVETVEPLYDDSALHHYEIGLSRGRV